jgi:hypothetical protein
MPVGLHDHELAIDHRDRSDLTAIRITHLGAGRRRLSGSGLSKGNATQRDG